MAKFIALTSLGLVDALYEELQEMGIKVTGKTPSGVEFDSNWEGCYDVNLRSRVASRVIKPILDFPAYNPDELYNNVLKHDFTKYIDVHQTIAIDASVRESAIRDQRFVAMKVKDAIVDQFREKFGERPSVDVERPDLRVMARLFKSQASLAIDTSGDSLTARGYRTEAGEAPLRENLAAGLLRLARFHEYETIIDPMCGSGTFMIEAAMALRKIAPGGTRKRFGFEKLKGFQPDAWGRVIDAAAEAELAPETPLSVKLFGYDKIGKVVGLARRNAERAGVESDVQWKACSVDMLPPPEPGTKPGLIIVNPPYGERIGVTEELRDVYKDLSFGLKKNFMGWTLWMLSGNGELTKHLKLKSSRKIVVYNGNIECRFLEYKIKQ
jgi:23S rRNA G2445 N2-methylase RlmL